MVYILCFYMSDFTTEKCVAACILVGNVWLDPWRPKLSLLFSRIPDFSHNLFSSRSPPPVLKTPIYYTQDVNNMCKNLMSKFLLFVFNSKERLSFFVAWGFWGRWQINYKAWENCFQTTLEKNKKPLKPFDSALVSSNVWKKKSIWSQKQRINFRTNWDCDE